MLTHFSLFTGIGGLDLAAEWAGFETVGQCEWADYPTKVLEKHWPDVPRWRDIRSVTKESYFERTGRRTVDIVSGGFPCQPFSTAGQRKGDKDDRYLWPEMLRVISEFQPTWVIGENVGGLVSMAQSDCEVEMETETAILKNFEMVLETIRRDFERIGYESQPILIPACGVGANHRRDRIFIMAWNTKGNRSNKIGEIPQGKDANTRGICKDVAHTNSCGYIHRQPEEQPTKAGEYAQCKLIRCSENVADTNSQGFQDIQGSKKNAEQPGNGTFSNSSWWDFEPNVGRVADGIPDRVDRLKGLGNAVVPYQAYPIFQVIHNIETGAI